MAEPEILLEYRGSIAVVRVNRPQVRNALNGECWRQLKNLFEVLGRDKDVRAIILTGTGDKAFIAGADIRTLRERSALETLWGENGAAAMAIEQCPKPTIAAVNGLALGGGCEVAMACDIRIASRTAKLGQTELNVGILPGAGGTQRLTQLVGLGRAMHMILTGTPIDAGQALEYGLVTEVTEPEHLMDRAIELAEACCTKSPITLRLAKIAIREGAKTNLTSGLQIEQLCQSVAFGTEDHLEGLTAFLEKRPPQYRGV